MNVREQASAAAYTICVSPAFFCRRIISCFDAFLIWIHFGRIYRTTFILTHRIVRAQYSNANEKQKPAPAITDTKIKCFKSRKLRPMYMHTYARVRSRIVMIIMESTSTTCDNAVTGKSFFFISLRLINSTPMEIYRVGMSAGNRSKHTVIMPNGEANRQQHVLLHAPPDWSASSAGNKRSTTTI